MVWKPGARVNNSVSSLVNIKRKRAQNKTKARSIQLHLGAHMLLIVGIVERFLLSLVLDRVMLQAQDRDYKLRHQTNDDPTGAQKLKHKGMCERCSDKN